MFDRSTRILRIETLAQLESTQRDRERKIENMRENKFFTFMVKTSISYSFIFIYGDGMKTTRIKENTHMKSGRNSDSFE